MSDNMIELLFNDRKTGGEEGSNLGIQVCVHKGQQTPLNPGQLAIMRATYRTNGVNIFEHMEQNRVIRLNND
jgi:hypothetical protein